MFQGEEEVRVLDATEQKAEAFTADKPWESSRSEQNTEKRCWRKNSRVMKDAGSENSPVKMATLTTSFVSWETSWGSDP